MQTQEINYHDGNTPLKGWLAFDEKKAGKHPAILVAHDWTGRNEFACRKAEELAKLGYVGFALDMYGQAVLGKTNEEKAQLIQPFMKDRAVLQKRVLVAFDTVQTLEWVDKSKMGAIGFCFGGLCALDLARSGAELKGVVSFHGLLNAPEGLLKSSIKAKILALHGHDDLMVPPEQVAAFEHEMTEAGVDWQMHIYGHTMHAFTNPVANDPSFGTVYKEVADKRSWVAMKDFFAEVFA